MVLFYRVNSCIIFIVKDVEKDHVEYKYQNTCVVYDGSARS